MTAALPGVDAIGRGTRIDRNVTVFRTQNAHAGAGIFIGDEVVIFEQVRLLHWEADNRLQIGNRVIVNVGCYLSGEGGLTIEDEVLIGPHSRLLSAGHGIHGGHECIARNPLTLGPVHIGRGAWIGGGATVLQGVRVGVGAVVAAGSVVTKDVPAFAIVAGNPARFKGFRRGMPVTPERGSDS